MKKEIRKEKDTAAENASPAAQSDVKEKMSENEGKVGGMLHDARLKKALKSKILPKSFIFVRLIWKPLKAVIMMKFPNRRTGLVLSVLMLNFWG